MSNSSAPEPSFPPAAPAPAPAARKKGKAPFLHRLVLGVSSVLLTILLLWLWSFLLGDIGASFMPDLEDYEKREISAELLQRREKLTQQTEDIEAEILALEESQQLLRDSTNSTRDTMNQLLANQKQLAEKNIALSPAEQEAIAQSQKLFLENQEKYQALNQQLTELNNRKTTLKQESSALEKQIEPARDRAYELYEKDVQRAELKAAALQLLILIPLFLYSLWLLVKKRHSNYALLYYPLAISLLLKTIDVIRDYFPARAFKYIALLAVIAAIVAIMVYLIRLIARPRPALLLKQYRESYDKLECPTCSYPINQGWLRAAGITRKRASKIIALPGFLAGSETAPPRQQPYCCPSCGERLFEDCTNCRQTRHALLPFCEHCGAEKPLGLSTPGATPPPGADTPPATAPAL